MPRPPKLRRVEFIPQVTVFKPAGVSRRDLEEEVLTVEELEAIRLKDLEGLEQEECAERMQVSRPTFQRVLSSAREKVARALVEGKAIRFEGGTYRLALGQFRCGACSHEFEAPFAAARSGADPACPHCGAKRGKRVGRAGRGHGHGCDAGHGPGRGCERDSGGDPRHGPEYGPGYYPGDDPERGPGHDPGNDPGRGPGSRPGGKRRGRCGRRWDAAQTAQGAQGVERDASLEKPGTGKPSTMSGGQKAAGASEAGDSPETLETLETLETPGVPETDD